MGDEDQQETGTETTTKSPDGTETTTSQPEPDTGGDGEAGDGEAVADGE